MSNLSHKLQNRRLRSQRVRSQISGTKERPRLSVHISNTHVTAQLIDDVNRKTVAYVTTVGAKAAQGTMVEKAEWVGSEIGKHAKTAKVKTVVFDRGGKLYHGRVAALAEAARKAGLEF